MHDTAVAVDIQSGTAVIACTAQVRQDFTLVFPRPFAAPPTVMVTAIAGQTTLAGITSLPLAVSAVICAFKRDGSNLAVGNVTVSWLAIGPRA